MAIRFIPIGYCPVCGKTVNSAAWDTKADKSDPIWGEPGKRFLLCRMGAHYHIELETPEGTLERYIFAIPYSLKPPKEGARHD